MNYLTKIKREFHDVEFNADIFRTKGEYCKLFISEKNVKITNQLIFMHFKPYR